MRILLVLYQDGARMPIVSPCVLHADAMTEHLLNLHCRFAIETQVPDPPHSAVKVICKNYGLAVDSNCG